MTKVNELNPKPLNIQEEYANAFRTESYTEFWTTVLALNKGNLATHRSIGSTTSARLPSYRLFVEHLLDPGQSTVNRILELHRTRPKIFSLFHDYFSNTSDASSLCGLLLKDIDQLRSKHKALKDPIDPSLDGPCTHIPTILSKVTQFSKSNPFCLSSPSLSRFKIVKTKSTNLLKKLEIRKNKTLTKLRHAKKLKCGSAVFLVALTASLAVVIVSHAFVLLVAAPGLMMAPFELFSIKKLDRWTAQLDAAAKGTYILTRDLETISRLVARLSNEMEHMEAIMQLWLERGEDQLQLSEEVALQLKKNDESFAEQIDELEENLYLCLMTINRARNLVVKEILNSGKTPLNSDPLSK